MKRLVEVGEDFVKDALVARYNELYDYVGNYKTRACWDVFVEAVLEGGLLEETTPRDLVDNYLVNSDICEIDDRRNEGEKDEEVAERLDPIYTHEADDGRKYMIFSFG